MDDTQMDPTENQIVNLITEFENKDLPNGYPGSYIGAISGLREACKEYIKTHNDIQRWVENDKANKARAELAKKQSEEREREVKISGIWRQQMDDWKTKNASAIAAAQKTGDWSQVPPEPKREEVTL
jgi:ABC-type nitrate/sulfonate/bicarbonate transport system substrate-binding protein